MELSPDHLKMELLAMRKNALGDSLDDIWDLWRCRETLYLILFNDFNVFTVLVS